MEHWASPLEVTESSAADAFITGQVHTPLASRTGLRRPEKVVPGSRIAGKYRVERQIAVGGMGVVYACTDLMLERSVAVKVIQPKIAQDESIKARFYLEARTLAQLDTPHVTRVFECGYTDDGQPYMVMELLEGIDLYMLLNEQGTLPSQRVARIALQVCRGLREAHRVGIVHRDLKPENLFLTRTSTGAELIKLLDFGISKQQFRKGRSLTNPTMNVGSPHYMSPEQIRAPSNVDGRADIWSLGVVMYELLTGRLPFEAQSWPDVCAAVLSEPVKPIGGSVPAAFEALVFRCLERDPAARFASADELARSLRQFVGRKQEAHFEKLLPVPVVPSARRARATQVSSARKKQRRRRGVLVAALAVLVAFAIAGSWTAHHTPEFLQRTAARAPWRAANNVEAAPAATVAHAAPAPTALPGLAAPAPKPMSSTIVQVADVLRLPALTLTGAAPSIATDHRQKKPSKRRKKALGSQPALPSSTPYDDPINALEPADDSAVLPVQAP